jgi:hypothetical protein
MPVQKITDIPKDQRDQTYAEIVTDLKPLTEEYGEVVLRWALNRLLADQREIAKAKKDKADAEARLKELGA